MWRNYANRDEARLSLWTVSSLSLTALSILQFFVWQMTCQLVVMFWSTARNLFIVKCRKDKMNRTSHFIQQCSKLYVFQLNNYNIFRVVSQRAENFYIRVLFVVGSLNCLNLLSCQDLSQGLFSVIASIFPENNKWYTVCFCVFPSESIFWELVIFISLKWALGRSVKP